MVSTKRPRQRDFCLVGKIVSETRIRANKYRQWIEVQIIQGLEAAGNLLLIQSDMESY